MNSKEELKKLLEIVKEYGKKTGAKLSRTDISNRLGFTNPTYLSQLIGESGKVNESHILLFKEKFAEELKAAGIPIAGDPLNEERAMIYAMRADYIERMALLEGLSEEEIEERLDVKAKLILKGLNARRR
ncbi:hypothetical protein ACE38W_14595 [Chitinophaga sp. Hz27]|uniref:hypothetical protein n=1 Tax=Chitinophaga sp. Hz27 TaxID=3347169 RepID=UPI0035DEF3BE